MTLLDTYNGFMNALAAGRMDEISTFVDPDALIETCVGLTGWTEGLDVALTNFRYGIGSAFADLDLDVRDIVAGDNALVVRARVGAVHVDTFLGVAPTGRRVEWDMIDMVKPGPDGRIAWRFQLCDWEGVRRQLLGEPVPSETVVHYSRLAPAGHPLAPPEPA